MNEIIITQTDAGFISGKLGEYSFDVECYAEPNEQFGLDFDGTRGRIRRLGVVRGFTLICAYSSGGWDVLPRFDADKDACAKIIRRFN